MSYNFKIQKMKKLIVNLTLPCLMVLISISGISKTSDKTTKCEGYKVPAVVYQGETIPSVTLPVMEIIACKEMTGRSDLNEKGSSTPDSKLPMPKRRQIRATT